VVRRSVDLRGAHAIVTGGSSGIGLETARQLAGRGATVSLIARGESRLEAAADDLRHGGATVQTRAVDVSEADALRSAIGELADAAGPCEVLVACAGVARPGRFTELSDEVFREMMEIDYFGTLTAMRAVVPGMIARGRGSVVAVSSAVALIGLFGYSAYTPAKYAVRGLMESLRAELKPHGVHAAIVYPLDTDTPQYVEEQQYKPAELQALNGGFRLLSPQEVAKAILTGIDRRRFAICPSPAANAMRVFAGLAGPVLNFSWDRAIAKVHSANTPPQKDRYLP
jgi:3-dehydrosphinganine reductase